ncbi:MAG: UDP-N-acetylglucosamine 1-carboxyvinyltransferase [Candidatus Latescibacteria bacterium]|jgi:UDP-N-acetylglucosamine 1-carboxyvinyltransferase|nr:UDP-N-acetylglucosamine 1-carboxyvinyltransferase [Candidatus Latescibacterota bacterium]MBT4140237.1 UDP-N-acetylglucosamine 1-carboxyvinyltransferase [Candidatus Latescibacterota bacterium]MBT5832531.1 UDP-N-acetylglucosamine 1-carboxyvinyltransferase [Candidatus Latescibacterota bacterium]
MDILKVTGPTPLRGDVQVPGAKNAISKLLTASMLTSERCVFSNAPAIGDTRVTQEICQSLGAKILEDDPRLLIAQTKDITHVEVPENLAQQNRLSVMMLAPLLHRAGKAIIPAAGGDRIGVRPVDFHLDGYRKMGANITEKDGVYIAETDQLKGAEITLAYPSVTTTENLLMAAVLANGRTFIHNAAIEPEIMDLVFFLQKMGAIIDYQIDRTFIIEGVDTLSGALHEVIPDRLVAESFAVAAIASKGDLFVRGAQQADLLTFLNTLRRVGGNFDIETDGIRFYHKNDLTSIALETAVHPGFMTDWHPPFAVLLTQAEGISVIHETVFEDRLTYVPQLQKMGADIAIYDQCLGTGNCRYHTTNSQHSALIKGPTPLHGTDITIPDLRAGFTYLLAAIIAKGETTIRGVDELDRGYESIDEALSNAGANIIREKE